MPVGDGQPWGRVPLGVMVTHDLGKSTGGTFNLEPDLDHLEVHWGGSPSFFPDSSTLLGKMAATPGMLAARVPAIGTFQVPYSGSATDPTALPTPGYIKVIAVDAAGNHSSASPAVGPVTPRQLSTQYISDLVVDKVTAGAVRARWVMSPTFSTAESGARSEMTSEGVSVFGSDGLTKVQMGLLSDGDYGFAAVNEDGQLTKMEDFVFGPRTATNSITGQYSLFSVYGDLSEYLEGEPGVGPAVTVTIGETGRAMVVVRAEITCSRPDTGVLGGYASFAMSGANTLGALDINGLSFTTIEYGTDDIEHSMAAANTIFLSDLNPGSTTFTMKYRNLTDEEVGTYGNRAIAVFPY